MYQRDILGVEAFASRPIQEVWRDFWHANQRKPLVRKFTEELINGVLEKLPEIDTRIRETATKWDFDRLAPVDRNILRVAVYEMFYKDETPPIVAINEAIDIAKEFSTDESPAFINGVLDRIKQDVMRPLRHAAGS